MLILEAEYILGFGLSILDNNYSTGEEGKYISLDGETYYVPLKLENTLKEGITYGYAGLRLSFLF